MGSPTASVHVTNRRHGSGNHPPADEVRTPHVGNLGQDRDLKQISILLQTCSGAERHPPSNAPHAVRPGMQCKLAVGPPDDEYEREADRTAERVTRMPEDGTVQSTCTSCTEEDDDVLRSRTDPGRVPPAGGREAPPVVREALRSPGRPLDDGTRSFMETRLGHDFRRVRVHTDRLAAASAAAVGALAYTVGSDVAFAAGRYDPDSPSGRRLLAHELAHTVQQQPSPKPNPAGRRLSRLAPAGTGEYLAREEGGSTTTAPAEPSGESGSGQAYGPSCSGGPTDPCRQSRCTEEQINTVREDIPRAIGYVNAAITALSQSPLAEDTVAALDWFFSSHSPGIARTVRARMECILACLEDTRANSRFGCHPDHSSYAYVCTNDSTPCARVLTDICMSSSFFGRSSVKRRRGLIHECAHREGAIMGHEEETTDVYEYESRFAFLDALDALQNADSLAFFAAAITEGVPASIVVPAVGASTGAAFPARGTPTWYARLYVGTEFQHPVLGIFNPTLGVGMTFTGESTVAREGGSTEEGRERERIPDTRGFLSSFLTGVRIGEPRPGEAGGVYASIFGGPAVGLASKGTVLGAEAGIGLGYRWRWVDVSSNVGYLYNPAQEAGLEHMVMLGASVNFVPIIVSAP